jgi:hypothetical protein
LRDGDLLAKASFARAILDLHAPAMFVGTEEEAAAIRTALEQRGELSAVVELRRLFPGIGDNVQARQCVRTIAGWRPLRVQKQKRVLRRPGKG